MTQTFAAAAFAASLSLLAVTQRRMVRAPPPRGRGVVLVGFERRARRSPPPPPPRVARAFPHPLSSSRLPLTPPPLPPRPLPDQASVSRRLNKAVARLDKAGRAHRRADAPTASASASASASSSSAVHLTPPLPGARSPAPARPALATTPPTVRAALCQLPVGADKAANIDAAVRAVADAAANGATLVVLPEMWNCPYGNEHFSAYAEEIPEEVVANDHDDEQHHDDQRRAKPPPPNAADHPSTRSLADAARAHSCVVVAGSIPERCARTGALYNTCCVFSETGALLAKHRKTHLFDVDIPGEITFRESDVLTPGEALTVVDTSAGRLGVGVCFDLRFPELAAACANRGAETLVFPGAFNTVTGPVHWELLQRARAVDNQVFVLTCSPARVEGAAYQAWGHSTAVGPFAEILATTDERPGTVFADLEMGEIGRRRRNMPLEQQRRGDLYALCDFGAPRRGEGEKTPGEEGRTKGG